MLNDLQELALAGGQAMKRFRGDIRRFCIDQQAVLDGAGLADGRTQERCRFAACVVEASEAACPQQQASMAGLIC